MSEVNPTIQDDWGFDLGAEMINGHEDDESNERLTFGEWVTKSPKDAATVALAGLVYGFVATPGNETIRGKIGGEAYREMLEAGNNGPTTALVVGGVVAATTAAFEATSVGLVGLGLHTPRPEPKSPRFKKWYNFFLDPEEKSTNKNPKTDRAADIGAALVVGCAAAAVLNYRRSETPELRKDIAAGMRTVPINTAIGGGIGALVAGGSEFVDEYLWDGASGYVIEYAPSSTFWATVLGVPFGAKYLYDKVKARGIVDQTAEA